MKCKYKIENIFPSSISFEEIKEIICKKKKLDSCRNFCEEGISGTDDNREEWNRSLTFC